MKINIIGGGAIGLFSAWYLNQSGHEVHVFDMGDLSDGCSYGNAGLLTPSHIVPLAAPGMIAQGMKWMFDSKSPFYVKPRLDWGLMQWLWRFYRSCNRAQAEAAMPVLLDFNLRSKTCYREFCGQTGTDIKLEERGCLMIYQTAKKEKEELAAAEAAEKFGVQTQVLDRQALQTFENGLEINALGAAFWPIDGHLYPNVMMAELKKSLQKNGVFLHGRKKVTGFEKKGRKVIGLFAGPKDSQGKGEKYDADTFIVSGGAWSAKLLKSLGKKLLLQDAKGYSITLKEPEKRPRNAAILSEAKVAVTPLGSDLRFAGTLELGGLSPTRNLSRVQGILDAVPQYYPELNPELPEEKNIWYGYRPCSPDGLPYIGRLKNFDNIILSTGHAMMGLSLAPATGEMVCGIVNGKEVRKDYRQFFDPDRY